MISLDSVRRQAASMGIVGVAEMDKRTLIRAIQLKEGHTPCYGTDWCKLEWKEACAWKEDCSAENFFID